MKNILLITNLFLTLFVFSQDLAPVSVHLTNFKLKNLQGEQVYFTNKIKTYKGITNEKGEFTIKLPAGIYNIKLKSIGDVTDYSTIEIPVLKPNQLYTDFKIEIQMSSPQFFTLNNITFNPNQAVILKTSHSELQELFNYLKLKKDIKIEISGHTDSDGDEKSNKILSLKRANAVKSYLIKKGINANRLTTKGYGETKPVADNSTSIGKAKNRRTEIKIL